MNDWETVRTTPSVLVDERLDDRVAKLERAASSCAPGELTGRGRDAGGGLRRAGGRGRGGAERRARAEASPVAPGQDSLL